MKRSLGYFAILLVCLGVIFAPNSANALEVTLAWDANTETNLAGYKIYYDDDGSGEPYDGTGAVEGPSPIDVENVLEFTLSGLSDNAVYFFAATAYNTDDPPLESGYSNEVISEVSINVTIVGSGNVDIVPPGNNGVYESGPPVTLTAQPDQFWLFGEWSGDVTGTNPVTVMDMPGDNKSVTATFIEKDQYVLTITTDGDGSVTFDPPNGPYYEGQTVTLTAVPNTNWLFSGWSGSISGTDNPYNVVINSSIAITATFSEIVDEPLNAPDKIRVSQ